MVQVLTNLSFGDFLKFNYSQYFKSRQSIISISIVSLLIISICVGYLTGRLDLTGLKIDNYPVLIIFLVVIIGSPLSVYFQSKNTFNSANGLKDPIMYTFTNNGVYTKGATFESTATWNMYHKIIETEKFFLLNQNKMALNIVPKEAFENKEQIIEVRNLITSQPKLKHKLRRD